VRSSSPISASATARAERRPERAKALSPKKGTVAQVQGGGWSYNVLTATPGIPGDSGSAFLNKTGQALGVLSTLQIAPLAGSNGVGDVGRELAYAQAHGGFSGLTLATGTEAFNPNALGAGV
jgi:hypothetical protein